MAESGGRLIVFPHEARKPEPLCGYCAFGEQHRAYAKTAQQAIRDLELQDFVIYTQRASAFVAEVRSQLPHGTALEQHRRMHEMMLNVDENLAHYFYNIMELAKAQ